MSKPASTQLPDQPAAAEAHIHPHSAISASFARVIPAALAALLGLALLYGAGFSGMEALHDAAHDSRHSAGFPCH
jgi:cobalt transporter subunit CbtB